MDRRSRATHPSANAEIDTSGDEPTWVAREQQEQVGNLQVISLTDVLDLAEVYVQSHALRELRNVSLALAAEVCVVAACVTNGLLTEHFAYYALGISVPPLAGAWAFIARKIFLRDRRL